jgi:hypothetical protein
MTEQFEERELRLLHETEEIEIETLLSETRNELHRVTVWVVVVGSHAYVRSVNGEQGHWYRQLSANRVGSIYAGEKRMPIRAVPVSDAQLLEQVNDAYLSKYGHYPHDVAWIIGPQVSPTTLRLHPHRAVNEGAESAAQNRSG